MNLYKKTDASAQQKLNRCLNEIGPKTRLYAMPLQRDTTANWRTRFKSFGRSPLAISQFAMPPFLILKLACKLRSSSGFEPCAVSVSSYFDNTKHIPRTKSMQLQRKHRWKCIDHSLRLRVNRPCQHKGHIFLCEPRKTCIVYQSQGIFLLTEILAYFTAIQNNNNKKSFLIFCKKKLKS